MYISYMEIFINIYIYNYILDFLLIFIQLKNKISEVKYMPNIQVIQFSIFLTLKLHL